MKSEVANWIASWPEWKRRTARKILAEELTQPFRENGDSEHSDETGYSDEQRETEQ